MFKTTVTLLAALAAVSIASIASAAVLVEYDFTGQPGDQETSPATYIASNVVATSMSRGAGIGLKASADRMGADLWTTGSTLDEDDYFEFTVGPDSGYMVSVDTINITEKRSSSAPLTLTIRSSLDNYASDAITPLALPGDTGTYDLSISLGSAFDDLMESITFRIYGYDAVQSTGAWYLRQNPDTGNHNQVLGEVTLIPEPGSCVLAILGLMSLAGLGFIRRQIS